MLFSSTFNYDITKKYSTMTAKAALCVALLRGDVVNIRTGFIDFGITNIPREISRMIEDESKDGFGVEVSRTPRQGKTRWGRASTWTDYRMNKTDRNLPGIEKMKAYVREQLDSQPAKTTQQVKKYQQIKMMFE